MKEYYHHLLNHIFTSETKLPEIAAECDNASSLITELEGGHGVAILSKVMKSSIGMRLVMRPLHGTQVDIDVRNCRAVKGDVTPAGEKFCDFVRESVRKDTRCEGARKLNAFLASLRIHALTFPACAAESLNFSATMPPICIF
jgi:hypothetical protein